MSQNSLAADRMQAILIETIVRRRRRRLKDIGAVIGVLFVALLACLVVVAFSAPADAAENIGALLGTVLFVIILPFYLILEMLSKLLIHASFGLLLAFVMFIIPIILYFRSQVIDLRRRMILSLMQTAIETGTPPATMIRSYAAACSKRYGSRLMKFAESLEKGRSLSVALNENPTLIRYDVCGILTLGADEKATLKTLEEVSQETRNRSLTQANSVFRVAYLLAVCIPMLTVVMFIHNWIAPQFEAIFYDFGLMLPPLTAVIFAVGVPVAMAMVMFLPLIAIFLFLYLMMQSDTVAWRPPLLRRLFRSVDAARFLRLFSMGLKNHVPIPEIVERYRCVVTSSHLKAVAERINKKIRSGDNWINAFLAARMITVGESQLLETAQRTGNLTTVIDQIAGSKDLKQTVTCDMVSKFVFIPSLLILGTLTGLFVIGMFLPIIGLIWGLVRII